jgi:hypothetical protein
VDKQNFIMEDIMKKINGFIFAVFVALFAGCDNPSTNLEDTLYPVLYPAPKPGPSITRGDGYLEVRFTTVVGAKSYRVFYSTNGSPSGAAFVDVPQPANQLAFCELKPLQNGVTYTVWAEAWFAAARSKLSVPASGAPLARPAAPPGSLTAYANSGSLDLVWTPVDDAENYIVYYNTTGGVVPPEGSESAEFYVDQDPAYQVVTGHISGLTNGTPYTVWIRAKNESGESNGYTTATGTPGAASSPPTAPNRISVTPSDGGLKVQWNAVLGATGYKLYYGTTNVSDDAQEATTTPQTINAGAGKMSATITGLTNYTLYYAWVKAVNGDQESSLAGPLSETPVPKPGINVGDSSFVLGTATAYFPNAEAGKGDRLSRKQETALGDLLADSMLWWAELHKTEYDVSATIDFAFVNGGLIVNAIQAGTITIGTLNTLLYPEPDNMSILQMTGTQVKTLFHDYVAKIRHDGGGGNGTGGFGQVSAGISYTIDYGGDPRGGVIHDLKFNGEPFDDNTTYTFVTNTWLVDGGDGYGPAFANPTTNKPTGKLCKQALIEYIYDKSEISPQTYGRITLKNEVWK